MLVNFLSALGLVFVFEGVMPFAFPERWKKLLKKIIAQDEKTLRMTGFLSMMLGVAILTLVHRFVD